MRLTRLILIIGASIAAAAALAHSGGINPAVVPRIETMQGMGQQMKVLGNMAKGEVVFDAKAAQAAVDGIAARAAEVPEVFRAAQTDPKSEALPTIWQTYGDFTLKAQGLGDAARVSITSEADLGPALGALGAACKDCHGHYKG